MQTYENADLKSDHIVFLVQKDVQWSETYAKTIFKFLQFLTFEIWTILYSKSLGNWPQYPHIWQNSMKNLFLLQFFLRLDQNAFQKIPRQWKKVSVKKCPKKIQQHFFGKWLFFCLKSSGTFASLKAPPPGPGCFSIESP